MRVAIVGGGVTGLVSAYDVASRGNEVVLYEAGNRLGGLASGFKKNGWNWYLDYAYHHLFTNDDDILNFAKETNFNGIYFTQPTTASLFSGDIYPLDSPKDLFTLPILSLSARVRTGAMLALLKYGPFLHLYEQYTSKELIEKTMGKDVWFLLWEQLFRKKFGKYAENILASFIWARIKKRTKKLGYVTGGFQELVYHMERIARKKGARIKVGVPVTRINKSGNRYELDGELYDAVIITTVAPIAIKLLEGLASSGDIERLRRTEYLHAVVLIIESKNKLLKNEYWLNINDQDIPIMGLIQHTNFVDKKHYGNRHILYVANYVESISPLLKMGEKERYRYFINGLNKIHPKFTQKSNIIGYETFIARNTQPVIDKNFLENKPSFLVSSLDKVYLANLDMTYPYDRGVNFAVKLGREVARCINK